MIYKRSINGINVLHNSSELKNAIVCIHGNSLSSQTFLPQFSELNIPLVALDLPGHGESSKFREFENIYNLPGYVNAVRAVVEALEIENIILTGHSLGGHIAIEALEELPQAKGAFIFGTPPIGLPPEMDKMFLPNPNMGFLFAESLNESEAGQLARDFVHQDTETASILKDLILKTDGNARTNLGASIGKGQFKNEREIIENTKKPIAIVHGEHDNFANLNYIQNLKVPTLWQNKVIAITNAGHVPHMENSVEFNQALEKFYSATLR